MTSVWRIIRSQYQHDRLSFTLGILVSLVPAAAGLLLLGVSGWFITAAALAGLSGAFLNIFAPSAIIRALAIMRTGGRYGERLLTHEATFRFLLQLRNQVFAGYIHTRRRGARSAVSLNRLTVDIAALDLVYLRLVVPGTVAIVAAVALVAWWASVSIPVLTTGFLLFCLWSAVFLMPVFRPNLNTARRADAALEAMRLRSSDLVAGRRDLSIYGGLGRAANSVLAAEDRLHKAEDAEEERALRLTVLSGLIGQLFLAAFLTVAILGVAEGEFGVAFAAGLVLVVMALPEIVNLVLPGLIRMPRVNLAARRVGGLLAVGESPGEIGAEGNGQPLPGPDTDVLCFEAVSFCYPGAHREAVEGLSFQVRPGEVMAVAGRSGCGKSTLVALAARLLDPERGNIFLDGEPLQQIAEQRLRSRITVLGQKPSFFNDTVAANLRIAGAGASDGELWAALEKAALADRIATGPAGLETVLGEGGIGLSGGELRRLALARAFLTRPGLFILDEMTEGLDEETASDVLDRFFAARGDAAVLMIAHKQRELDRAGRVLHLGAR